MAKINYVVCDRCGNKTLEQDWNGCSITANDRLRPELDKDLCPACTVKIKEFLKRSNGKDGK